MSEKLVCRTVTSYGHRLRNVQINCKHPGNSLEKQVAESQIGNASQLAQAALRIRAGYRRRFRVSCLA